MTSTETYATAVVRVLRDHFPDLADPVVAAVVTHAVERQAREASQVFEVIVDDPRSARWRLKARSDDRTRVRLAYCPVILPGSDAGNELERTVNDALRALEADGR
jgi:hypothetical protein